MVFWRKKKDESVSSGEDKSAASKVANERSASTAAGDPLAQQTLPGETKIASSHSEKDIKPETDQAESATPEDGGSWFKKLRSALHKTNQILQTDIRDLWKSEGRLVDDDFLRELFVILVRTDMGQPTATRIRDRIGREFRGRKVTKEEVLESARSEILASMQNRSVELQFATSGPTVILVVGVNGAGKTTSIAKLAYRLRKEGRTVILGAGDTFRAAAVEQLKIWSQRIGCEIVSGEMGSDPGSVAFKAVQRAREENFDVCIIDTAGRLQTQVNLMQQLEKIRKIAAKQIDGAPHEVLLVLDATAGQNAISQARGFSDVAGCTGIILAKLDGSAKGGVVVPIMTEFSLPVKLVGLGEKLPDMAPFDPEAFTRALLSFDN
ncbi:MAG: signal recognition particle-docking protein FtsY [Planctomycetota bacterium]|nr:signal recognition particle-docking protein FtsY [Planctomycetota bacterium]